MKSSNRIMKGLVIALIAIVGIVFLQDVHAVSITQDVLPSLAAAPLVTIFAKDIETNIFPANEFYMQSKDDSPFVNGNSVKHPVSGAKPNIEIDRTSLPATIAKRTDDSNDYDLHEFTSDPTLIQDSEELVVNYNKRANVLSDHSDQMNTKIAEYFANLWLPNGADNIVRSTGTATRTASAPSATGNRKRIIAADMIALAERFNRMDAPQAGRNFLIPSEFLSDLLSIDGFTDASKIGTANLIDGSIGRLLGFNIWVRSSVGAYSNASTPVKNAFEASGTINDNLAALAWYDKWVNRAKGSVKVYSNMDLPEYYGSIFSAMVRAGGKTRKDLKGVVALVESHS